MRRFANHYSQESDQGNDAIEGEEDDEIKSLSGERMNESEDDLSNSDRVSENDEGKTQNKETSFRRWRSVLLKSGQGPFLQPQRLKEKLHL